MPSVTFTASTLFSILSLAAAPTAASANLFRGGDAGGAKVDRIIGGWKAQTGRYPYSVSLQNFRGHYCGGSMITKDTVLTAAHCIDGGGTVVVRIGSDSVRGGESIGSRKLVVHPNYKDSTDQNDVGLIFLKQSVDIGLVSINDDNNYPRVGQTAHTIGWGDIDPGDKQVLSETLREVDIQVISNDACKRKEKDGISYGNDVTSDMICTDTPNKDACQGDSGGPLIIKGNNAESDVQVGIVSWGYGCAYLPGVFARTSTAYGWIERTVCEESNDPGPICGTPEPTPFPTRPPTPPPTKNPTKRQTRLPTKQPTKFPTRSPTKRPTRMPTKRPTKNPTVSPSNSPTLSPSFSPTTATPTTSPTLSPTSVPSFSSVPTGSPSFSPTISAQPTSHPTGSPSISLSPTAAPSASPTASSQPTESPSMSQSPSTEPSSQPTISHQPTISVEPTATPTNRPSNQPSSQPSDTPSAEPSALPSSAPSISKPPSSEPSVAPSFMPSYPPTATTSPTVSSHPTVSAQPTLKPAETDVIIPGNALVFTDLALVADSNKEDTKEKSISSARVGDSFVLGALVSGILSLWVMV